MTKRLLIACPAKGGLPDYFLQASLALTKQGLPGWDVEFLVESGNHSVNMSRNILAHSAIACGYDRMLTIDKDHPWTIEHVTRILSHHEPIVSGLYCKKRPGKPFWLGIATRGAKVRPDYLLEADFVPTGFLSVSIAALKKIREDNPDREFLFEEDGQTRATMCELFPIGVAGPRTAGARMRRVRALVEQAREEGSLTVSRAALQDCLDDEQEPGRLMGEDYYFAFLAKRSGFPLYIDVKNVVTHEGTITYPITDPGVVATKSDPIPVHEGDMSKW